ncbi:hypothetical protein AAG570_005495 [Ranatra chinensis]|uniref:Uncharacterized protein n=1 Tax=Ranatra chinensis TaxID=642074 RepID=A0ABD0YL74_9HEMI
MILKGFRYGNRVTVCVGMREAAEAERVTSRALKAQLEKAIDEQKDVRLLEASLARVRTKLGKAVESERRLSEELEKEREENEKLRRIVSVHDQALVQDTSLLETSRADMKVIFIEHCGVIHQWNKRVVEEIE